MTRAPKVCPQPGCPLDQPCPTHTPAPWAGSSSRGFPSKIRARILRRDPLCRCPGCPDHAGPCGQRSTIADHVIPVAWGGSDNASNGQGLCSPCHDHKTRSERITSRTGTPPPGSPSLPRRSTRPNVYGLRDRGRHE